MIFVFFIDAQPLYFIAIHTDFFIVAQPHLFSEPFNYSIVTVKLTSPGSQEYVATATYNVEPACKI